MKKITLLIFLFITQILLSQQLTHSASQTITDLNSIACEQQIDVTSENTFYRSFNLADFGISSAYDITSIEYGIENLSGTPTGGYPITVKIYTSDATFPTGNLTLINEATEMLQNQSLQVHNTPISATIPAGSEIVVGIYVPSDATTDGGNGQVSFQIGSNSAGETAPSYFKAPACGLTSPVTFESQGRPDIHMVMNINGSSQTAGLGDLLLVDFGYYPNPVKDKLTMNAKETISNISIYNTLGQKLASITPKALKAEIDLTQLSSGVYMVKATVNERSGAFRIVKD